MRSSFNYPRHFVLLGAFTAMLAIANPRGLTGIGGRFALYGALHAAALAFSAAGRARPSMPRRLWFVAAAALLSLATARLGLFGLRAVDGIGGSARPFAILAACAALGALAYGALIYAVLVDAADRGTCLRMQPLIAIPLLCAGANSLSLALSRSLHSAGVLWLVAPWWFAFSGGLRFAGAEDSHKMPL